MLQGPFQGPFPYRTTQQKKYNTWKNIRKYVGPKEIEKTTQQSQLHSTGSER